MRRGCGGQNAASGVIDKGGILWDCSLALMSASGWGELFLWGLLKIWDYRVGYSSVLPFMGNKCVTS